MLWLPPSAVQVSTEYDNEDENRVLLLVHDTKPPFLEGKVVGTKGGDIVLPLRDPTSDMAVIARKGSDLVKQVCAAGFAHPPMQQQGHITYLDHVAVSLQSLHSVFACSLWRSDP